MSEEVDDTKTKAYPLGLRTDNENPVPLKSIKVDVSITGYVAEVSSSLTYFNEETIPVEAVFTFPVDDGSAVFQFEADIDGRHIVAEIQEKEQAILTYKDAVDHGKTAMLLKEDNSAGDIFSCMLGNLPPESEAILVMKYVIELSQEPDGKLRFTLPTILNPRYSPDAGTVTAAEGATYVAPCKIPYDFSMTLKVKGYHKVTSVSSDQIQLDVQFEENDKIAKVAVGDEFKFDHDLCLYVEYEEPFTPQVILEDANPDAEGLLKEDILMVSFHPDLKEVAMATNGEYVFVIDRSGSMMENINNAKEALLLFLKSLPSECYFNIISFGSTFSALFSSGSKKYSNESLKTAKELLEKMGADLGGTEILKPLNSVFSKKLIEGHPRRVFILTDGEVSNTNDVIKTVKKHSHSTDTRVFSLGIGHGASTSLIKGVAKNGGGKAEFVTDNDRIQPKVISLLKCAMQPALTDITINWDLPPDISPVCIPVDPPTILIPKERLSLFVILKGVDRHTIYAPSKVTVEGKRDLKPVSYSMTFTLSEVDDISTSAPVHRLATKAQIKILQDEESPALKGDYFGSWNSRDEVGVDKIQSIRKRIIDLSCHGNIISKYTAFVAIDVEGKKVEGKSMERSCPVPTMSEDFQKGLAEGMMMRCVPDCHPDSGMALGSLNARSAKFAGMMMHCVPDCHPDSDMALGSLNARSAKFASRGFVCEDSCSENFADMALGSLNARSAKFASRGFVCEDSCSENFADTGVDSLDACSENLAGMALGSLNARSAKFADTGLDSLDACSENLALSPATFYKSKRKTKGGSLFGCGLFSQMFSKKSRIKGPSQKTKPSTISQDSMDSAVVNCAVKKSVDEKMVDLTMDEDDTSTVEGATDSVDSAGPRESIDNKVKDLTQNEDNARGNNKVVSMGDMLSVIKLQELQGQWIMSDKLMNLLGVQEDQITKLNISQDSSVVCTVVVLGWLRKYCGQSQDEWQMIEAKALLWLSSKQLDKPAEDTIKEVTQALWPE